MKLKFIIKIKIYFRDVIYKKEFKKLTETLILNGEL